MAGRRADRRRVAGRVAGVLAAYVAPRVHSFPVGVVAAAGISGQPATLTVYRYWPRPAEQRSTIWLTTTGGGLAVTVLAVALTVQHDAGEGRLGACGADLVTDVLVPPEGVTVIDPLPQRLGGGAVNAFRAGWNPPQPLPGQVVRCTTCVTWTPTADGSGPPQELVVCATITC